MTFDLRSATMHGAYNCSRVRVLWRDGMLKVFTVDGLHLELETKAPVRRPYYMKSWLVETEQGDIILKGKCMTCGGRQWWRIGCMPFEQLWRMKT